MEKFYRQLTASTLKAAIVAAIFFHYPLFAQQPPPPEQGVIRLKVTEDLARQLETSRSSRTINGEILTGIPSLDNINRQYKAKRYTRVFAPAGKNEARHRKHGLHLWYEVTIEKSSSIAQAVRSYRSDEHVAKAEPVYKKIIYGSDRKNSGPRIKNLKSNAAVLLNASNDPLLGSQWHYHNTGQTGGVAGADIGLFEAWKIETGSNDVIVAVTDGGIQTDHPDLAANMWVNRGEIPGNNADDDHNGYVDDVHGYSFVHSSGTIEPHDHGTHVGGTIAAVSNNGVGVAGVAGGSGSGDGIQLMSCAVFGADSYGGFPDAYVYAADNGAVISQNSWGYAYPGVYEESVLAAIDYFIAEAGKDEHGNQVGPMRGGIVIFSAGNNNSEEEYYPQFYPPVLAVGSTTHEDKKALYSNYGSWVDIAAPGGETYARDEEGVISTLPRNQYGSFMGTSMACPHVSGVAGLILSKFGKEGFTPNALRERLRHSADNIDALNSAYTGKLGMGRINAALALTENDQTVPQPIRDLAIADVDVGNITVSWTSPGDESGFIAAYDIRYSTSPITSANFSVATVARDIPDPKPEGTTETFAVEGLKGGIQYYFAIRSTDFEGNVSDISNVVSETAALTPVIALSPSAISEDLQTAENSAKTLTISNTGAGPLKYFITDADEDDFSSVTPLEGVISPGGQQVVTVSFDANGLLAGTYHADLIIEHNDPEENTLQLPVTLNVTNNNAPIAAVTPAQLDFVTAQTGTTVRRTVTVSNSGSDPLIITDITSSNPAFGAQFSADIKIPSFTDAKVHLTFSPQSTGLIAGEVSLHTNDPENNIFKIKVKGEGLSEQPITVLPDAFDETLEPGGKVVRTLILRNNGSTDRTFRLEATNGAPVGIAADPLPQAIATPDTVSRLDRLKERNEMMIAKKSAAANRLVHAIAPAHNTAKSTSRTGKVVYSEGPLRQYQTGFEDFTPQSINGQHNWYSTQGWTVSDENADRGKNHFRGTTEGLGGGEKFALSPYLFEYEDYHAIRYSTISMRVNLDNARGQSWEIVPQDGVAFVSTRLRINADGTMDAMVIDNEYESHWKRVPAPLPSGYFDLAIEYDIWGTDTSGFPTYLLYINNQHVLSGTGLGFGIGQVAFISTTEASGPTLDIDKLVISEGQFIPTFMRPSPASGILPAGGSVEVTVEFDAAFIDFGSYESELRVHIDERDTLIVPARLTVRGQHAGYVNKEQWNDVPGSLVSSIPLETEPSFTEPLSSFESPSNTGDNYGSRIRGFVAVPISGEYRFWIASNDKSELWLSTDSNPANKVRIAYVSGYTAIRDWTKYPTQQSAPIHLDAGQKYYLEALHKEGVGTDHLAVGWQLPNGAMERPIPGSRLLPFESPGNQAPAVAMNMPGNGQTFPAGATVEIYAEASDPDGYITNVAFFNGDEKLIDDATAPYQITWSEAMAGNYILTAVATDNEGLTASDAVSISVEETSCTASGTISREYWTNIEGNHVSAIPVNTAPHGIEALTLFEGPLNAGIHYGVRIAGYLCPPQTGQYYFWIASNDHSELWLSTDEDPLNKRKIAFVSGATGVRQWDRYASQRSVAVTLTKGKKYYIEALHKQGVGTDHIAVGWQLPDGTPERPIGGNRLSPFEVAPSLVDNSNSANQFAAEGAGSKVVIEVFPNPVKGNRLNVNIHNLALATAVERQVQIRQLTGESIYSQTDFCSEDCSTEINLSQRLFAGVYILQIKIGGKVFVKKLVVD